MRTLIKKVRLIDGKGSAEEGTDVLVADGRIARVGKGIPCEDAVIVDGTGKTLIPGLIDCHVHLGLQKFIGDEVETAAAVAVQSGAFARWGVTTVRNMGTKYGSDIAVRNLIERGYMKGPRIVASGQGISITGGHGWWMDWECDTPEETRIAARKIIRSGADLIKLFATGGMGTKGSIPSAPQLSEDQMRVAVEEAERAGLLTAAHATGIEGAQRAIRAGVRSIEHIPMDEETAGMMKEHGCWYCPTVITRYNILHTTDPDKQWMRRKARPEDLDKKKRAIALCLEYGIPICAGTDSFEDIPKESSMTRYGLSLCDELSLYHAYGLTAYQALQTATKTASEMLRLDGEIGTVEEGKKADLVLLAANPLDDLGALKKVLATWRDGEVLYRKAEG